MECVDHKRTMAWISRWKDSSRELTGEGADVKSAANAGIGQGQATSRDHLHGWSGIRAFSSCPRSRDAYLGVHFCAHKIMCRAPLAAQRWPARPTYVQAAKWPSFKL